MECKGKKRCCCECSSCPAGTEAFLLFSSAAYAARGKAGPVMGLRPLLGPPCIPPEAPPVLPRPPNIFFGGGYARTSPTCRFRFFMTPPPAMACTSPEKLQNPNQIAHAVTSIAFENIGVTVETGFFTGPIRVSALRRPQAFSQRKSAQWHCAARREIAERSEEAPEAKAAQPSRNDGNVPMPAGHK